MSPALRRELLLAALRASACAVPALFTWSGGAATPRPAGVIGLVGLPSDLFHIYLAVLAGVASLCEGALLRRPVQAPPLWKAAAVVALLWWVFLLGAGLGHAQAVYAAGVLEGGLDAGHAAVLEERDRLDAFPVGDLAYITDRVWVVEVAVWAAAAIALASCALAQPLARRSGTGAWRVAIAWLLAVASTWLLATTVMTLAWAGAPIPDPLVAWWLGAIAAPLLGVLSSVWLLSGLVLPRDGGQGPGKHGLSPAPPAA